MYVFARYLGLCAKDGAFHPVLEVSYSTILADLVCNHSCKNISVNQRRIAARFAHRPLDIASVAGKDQILQRHRGRKELLAF